MKILLNKKAQQYWNDHQLWRFIKFDIGNNDRTNENDVIGVVEHNKWKFFISDDDCIRYITPNLETGYFIIC